MPPKKPRKTTLKSSTLPIEETLENIIQSPIRISSRTNKSTSTKFNSDEYLVYYPTKRHSPLKTPDSTHKRRKRVTEIVYGKSQVCPTSSVLKGVKAGQETSATITSPSRSWSSSNRGNNLKWESKSWRALKRTDGGQSHPDSILPISITDDGRFTCAPPASNYLSQEEFLKEEPEPYYGAAERDWVLLKNRGEGEDTLHHPSIFATQIELELGTAPLPLKTRKEPDPGSRDVNEPLYALCRNWVRTKLNRPPSSNNHSEPEDPSHLDKDGNIEGLTRLPPPIPSSTPNNARIPTPLTVEERNNISRQLIEQKNDGKSRSKNLEITSQELDRTVQKMGNITLLDEHLAVWKRVRSKWVKAAALDDLRYEDSFTILTKLYERNAGCVPG